MLRKMPLISLTLFAILQTPVLLKADDVPIAFEEGMKAPKVIHRVAPNYPEDARKAGIMGKVILKVTILKTGEITHLEVLQSLREDLDRNAMEAVKQWRFEPALKDGEPVSVFYHITVNFRLNGDHGYKKVGGTVIKPIVRHKVPPIYPEAAKQDGITGKVGLSLKIDATGEVVAAKVTRSLREDLDEAALKAARQWRFEPATENGQPVAVLYTVTLNFRLQ